MSGQTSIYGLCRGKNALFTHILLVATSKLLQGETYPSLIDKTRPIMKNVPVVALAFNMHVSCCRDHLVHKCISVCVEQTLHWFCKLVELQPYSISGC